MIITIYGDWAIAFVSLPWMTEFIAVSTNNLELYYHYHLSQIKKYFTKIYRYPKLLENFSHNHEPRSAYFRRIWKGRAQFVRTYNPSHLCLKNDIVFTQLRMTLRFSPLLRSKWFGIMMTPRYFPFLTLKRTNRFESAAARKAALVYIQTDSSLESPYW